MEGDFYMDSKVYAQDNFCSNNCLRLYQQHLDGVYTDVVIETKHEVKIKAHRNVLVAAFPNLERTSRDEMASGYLSWPRFDEEVVLEALKYAYLGWIELNVSKAVRLLLLSANLKCAQLRDWCVSFLTTKNCICKSTFVEIWRASNCILDRELMKACADFMGSHVYLVPDDSHIWEHVRRHGMRLFLEAASFHATALEILESWLQIEDPLQSPGHKLEGLVDELNLRTIPFIALLSIHGKVNALHCREDCKKRVEEALKEVKATPISNRNEPSTSRTTTVVRSRQQQLLQVKFADMEHGIGKLNDVPALGSRAILIDLEVPWRFGCSYVMFIDSIWILGGEGKGGVPQSTCNRISLTSRRIGPSKGLLENSSSPPLQVGRSHFSAVATEGCILVFGGSDGRRRLSSCECYKVSNGRWTFLPELPEGRSDSAAVCVPNEGVLVIGGVDDKPSLLADVQLLKFSRPCERGDRFDSTWEKIPSLVECLLMHYAAYHNGKVYALGQSPFWHRSVETMEFPAGDNLAPQWTRLTLPEGNPDSFLHLSVLNERLLIIMCDGQVLEYQDPTSSPQAALATGESSWKPLCQLAGPLFYHTFLTYNTDY